MFYIADIDGVTIPYEGEAFRQRRDVERLSVEREAFDSKLQAAAENRELESIEAEALAEGAQLASDRKSDAVVLGGSIGAEGGGVLDRVSSQTVGLAGASALLSSGARKGRAETTEVEAAKFRKPAQRMPAGAIQAARGASLNEHTTTPEHQARDASSPHVTANQYVPLITAGGIMNSKPPTLSPDDSIREAGEKFRSQSVRYLPVVSEEGKLVGILSDRDFLRAEIGKGTKNADAPPQNLVSDIMVRNVLSAVPEAGLREISEILFRERIGAMPIIDRAGKILGMVTRDDVLKAVIEYAPSEIWHS